MPEQAALVGRAAGDRGHVVDRDARTAARACRGGTRRRSRPARRAGTRSGSARGSRRRGSAGRSASQLNAPADSRARPLASVAVTVGVERAARRVGPEPRLGLGEHRRRHRWLLRPIAAVRASEATVGRRRRAGEPRQHPIAGREPTRDGGRHAAGQARSRRGGTRDGRGRARGATADARASRRRSTGAARPSAGSASAPSAISSFVRPSAARRRTSSSRGESGSTGRSGCPVRTTAGPARGTPRPRR